jgi:hypothetical protein
MSESKYVMKKAKNCACVIHGTAYDWIYVERLYNMLQANTSYQIRLHVFTEDERSVPAPFVKHRLVEWPGIAGPKKSWWYKMQMFNPAHELGRVLYFDLDTVITGNIDWIWQLSDQYFWAIRDFKYLWRNAWNGINSSVMIWDTNKFDWIWRDFTSKNVNATVKLFHGDQDYLSSLLDDTNRQFFQHEFVKSWRWQIHDGGLNMKTRLSNNPNSGTILDRDTSILIFHGHPKPHEIHDPVIEKFWKINIV